MSEKKEPEKVSDFITYYTNPSTELIKGLVKFGKKEFITEKVTVVKEGGETFEDEIDTEEFIYNGVTYIDRGRFTKFFKGTEDEIKGLNSSAIGVLMYVVKNLKNGNDEIIIDVEGAKDYLGYKSKASVYDGIFGLLKAEFIYRKAGWEKFYFVNVNKIFNGQRAKLKGKE